MKLDVELRDLRGKDVNKLRREGKIPAVIYGKHMDAPISIVCDKNEFVKLYKKVWTSTPITLKWKDIEEMVLIYDFQLDPVSDVVLHVDFLWIKKGEKVTTEVSIVIQWEELSPIVKSGDANIQLVKDFIEVEALPKDLPKEIVVDVSYIDDLSETIFVKDLEISSAVEIKDDLDKVVVTVIELKDIPEEEEEPTVDAAGEPIDGAESEEDSWDNEENSSSEKSE